MRAHQAIRGERRRAPRAAFLLLALATALCSSECVRTSPVLIRGVLWRPHCRSPAAVRGMRGAPSLWRRRPAAPPLISNSDFGEVQRPGAQHRALLAPYFGAGAAATSLAEWAQCGGLGGDCKSYQCLDGPYPSASCAAGACVRARPVSLQPCTATWIHPLDRPSHPQAPPASVRTPGTTNACATARCPRAAVLATRLAAAAAAAAAPAPCSTPRRSAAGWAASAPRAPASTAPSLAPAAPAAAAV